MKTIRFITATLLFVIAVNVISFGQNDNGTAKIKYNTWSATLSGGSMLFYGDIRNFDFYPVSKQNSKDWFHLTNGISERKWGFGLSVNKQLSPMFGLQLQLQNGKLAGIKNYLNRYFEANVMEYGINGIINFGNLFFPVQKNHKFNVYGMLGISIVDFKTIEKTVTTDSMIHSYGYGDFGQPKERTTEYAIPVGIGMKYKINKRFDIGLESQLLNINTDKLDAHVRVNSAKDKYGYTSVALTYKIGKNEKSLEWVTPKEMEADELTPIFKAIDKKIDSLGNKLNEIDGKVTQVQKDIASLKNPAKEADDDNDGVPNSKDLEPNTPAGNLVNFQGITIPKSGTGIAEMKPQFSIFFTVNSVYIDALNEEKIAAAAKMLKDDPNLKFQIVGHADKTGGQVYNELLSKKRAQTVYDDLVKSYGIDGSRLTVVGKGINEPLSSDNLSINRRVDFIIQK